MSLNKNLLAATIGALLLASNVQAQVVLDGTDTDAIVLAEELERPVSIAATVDADDDVSLELGYNFSAGEVRYGRFDCVSGNATLTNVAVSEASADISIGAINGTGTSAVYFSITAADPIGGATEAETIEVDADFEIDDREDVVCSWALYDQPSQAQAGGTTGRILYVEDVIFTNAASYVFTTTADSATADVAAAGGAYTDFVAAAPGIFGAMTFELSGNATVDETLAPVTFAGLFDADTAVTVEGDFSAATDLEWDGNGSTDSSASTFVFEGNAEVDGDLEYIETGADEIQISTYTATLAPVFNLGYEQIQTHTARNAGEIDRNGTELVAPLAQVPAGWLSRVAVVNNGNEDRTFTVTLNPATGATTNEPTSSFSGALTFNASVDAGETAVLSVADMFPTASFTGPARGTITVTAEAPREQIDGLYQIVNPTSGSISNHIMIEPGTN